MAIPGAGFGAQRKETEKAKMEINKMKADVKVVRRRLHTKTKDETKPMAQKDKNNNNKTKQGKRLQTIDSKKMDMKLDGAKNQDCEAATFSKASGPDLPPPRWEVLGRNACE